MKEGFPPIAIAALPAANGYAAQSRARMRTALVALALMVVGLFGAMAFIPIGGAVIANGQVAPETKVKQVAHLTGGTVSQIAVRDGDRVRRGQVLVRLDTRVSAVDAELSGRSLDQLVAQRARLQAELGNKAALQFPPDLARRTDPAATSAMAAEVQRFALNRAEQASLVAQVDQRITQLQRQIDSYVVQIASLREQQRLIEPELEGVRSLKARGFVTIHQLNELERTAVQLQGSIGALQAQIAESNAAISQANEQRIQLRQTARAQAGKEAAQVDIAINSQRVSHAAADVTFERAVIRAPYSGVVDKLAISSVGDVVKPADTILTIVPDTDRLILEAAVAPADIDRVHEGQAAGIRLSAFSRNETPELTGRVLFVSAETIADAQSQVRFYRARVQLDRRDEAWARRLGVVAGMPVEVFIQTGKRSMLSYITKPLRDHFSRAMRDD